MKSKIFTAALAVSLGLAAQHSYGCGYVYDDYPYTPVFRACDDDALIEWNTFRSVPNNSKQENCELWQLQTSADIPLGDIESIVYRATLPQLCADSLANITGNRFAQWLVEHPEDLQLLQVAKETENLRRSMIDAWYYPCENDAEHADMRRLLAACDDYTGTRMKARYAVQAVRLLFTDGKYDECISRWENEWKHLPDNILRRMICSYVGGAYYRNGDTENALRLYSEGGDNSSLNTIYANHPDDFPSQFTNCDVRRLEFEFKNCPESQFIGVLLQNCVTDHEFYKNWRAYGYDPGEELKTFCLQAATSGRTSNPALWWYALSYLQFIDGETSEAARNLRRAETSRGTEFIKESIRSYRLLVDSRSASSGNFNNLLSIIQWIDGKIGALSHQDLCQYEVAWQYRLVTNRSVNYWNDIVVRSVCAEAAPRLVASGRTTEALQLANYSVNRITGIGLTIQRWDDETNQHRYISFDQMRGSNTEWNCYDYRNQFFDLCDSLSADQLAAYVTRTFNPRNAADRFFSDNSYTDRDYLCDLVGTHYLREMRYDKACEWLGMVSTGFQRRTNIAKAGYFKLDPFAIQENGLRFISDNSDYKYRFATEMLSLERAINDPNINPDRRALAKVKFAKGLRNSFGRCWYLTQYGYSFGNAEYVGRVCRTSDSRQGYANNPHAQTAYARVDALYNEALSEFTEPEIAAQVHLELMNLRTLMTQYRDTEVARSFQGSCDSYHDYALQRR